MRALITGATGFIGSHMAEFLVSEGWEIVCAVRNISHLRHLKGIKVEILPLASMEDQIGRIAPLEYVIHLAGLTRASNYEAFSEANVLLTRRLLDLFTKPDLKASLKRFVLVSSQSAAGPSPDGAAPVKETDPPRPVSLYGRSKLEAEEAALTYRNRLPLTIVRPPTVFGPRDTDVLGVFRAARFRLAAYIAGPERLVNIIFVEDLIQGILAAATSPNSIGETYFLANPEPVAWREFALTVARIMGYRAVALPVPLSLLKVAALAGDLMAKITGSPPLLYSDKLRDAEQIAWVCSTEKASKELHWQPRTSIEEAVKTTAGWYYDHGWI